MKATPVPTKTSGHYPSSARYVAQGQSYLTYLKVTLGLPCLVSAQRFAVEREAHIAYSISSTDCLSRVFMFVRSLLVRNLLAASLPTTFYYS